MNDEWPEDWSLSDEAIDAINARLRDDMAAYAERRERRLWLGLAAIAVLGVLAILTVGAIAFLAVVVAVYLVGDEHGFNDGWNRACRMPVDAAIALEEYQQANRSWRDED